jgi:Flp pilus assembly protein TadD
MRWERLRPAAPWGALALILLVGAAAYVPALDAEFLFDDQSGIVENPRIAGIARWTQGFDLRQAVAGRPVTELTFALDVERARLDPRTFHETSLALHLIAGILVFLLGRALVRRAGFADGTWIALAASAAFVLHPIQCEAVAYASQRAEVLGSLLGVLSLMALLSADQARSVGATALRGAAALLLFALALGAKPVAAGIPIVFILVLAVFPDAGGNDGHPATPWKKAWTRRFALAVPLVALVAIQGAEFFGAIGGRDDVGFSIPDLGPWRYLLTQARVLPLYLRLLFWPAGLTIDHDIAPSEGFLDPATTLLGALLVLGLVAAAIAGLAWALRSGVRSGAAPAVRLAAFGFLWFLLLLAPTSSIVPLADVAVEHRLYLASWGLFVGLAALSSLAADRLDPAIRRWALPCAGVVLGVALTVALSLRAGVWSSALSIWTDAAEKSPGKARVFTNLGHSRHGRGDLEGALDAYKKSIVLGGGTRVTPLVAHNMASTYLAQRRHAEARQILRQLERPEPETLVLLTFVELEDGDLAAASRWASTAVMLAPGYPRSHEAAGRVSQARGDIVGAREAYRRSVRIFPSDPNTLLSLARLEAQTGDLEAACRTYGLAMAAPGNRFASSWAASDARSLRCK